MIEISEFEDISDWISLDDILVDCCETGAEVVVYGKVNRFRAVIECVENNCSKIKLKYHLEETGYPDGHTIEACDIESIRCKACCDENWFSIDDCTNPDLTSLPAYPPEGNSYLYSGDINSPGCVYKYLGFGSFRDIDYWIKLPGNDIESFNLSDYVLTITMTNGETHSVTLVANTLASVCFDAIEIDLDDLDELT